jgi:hypothetical protein
VVKGTAAAFAHSEALVLPSSWLKLLCLTAITGIGAALISEINALVSARRSLKKHPLLFFETLPQQLEHRLAKAENPIATQGGEDYTKAI